MPVPGFSSLTIDREIGWESSETPAGSGGTSPRADVALGADAGGVTALVAIGGALFAAWRILRRRRAAQVAGASADCNREPEPPDNPLEDGQVAAESKLDADVPSKSIAAEADSGLIGRSDGELDEPASPPKNYTGRPAPAPTIPPRRVLGGSKGTQSLADGASGSADSVTMTQEVRQAGRSGLTRSPRSGGQLLTAAGSGVRRDRAEASSRVELFVKPEWQRR